MRNEEAINAPLRKFSLFRLLSYEALRKYTDCPSTFDDVMAAEKQEIHVWTRIILFLSGYRG